MKRDTTICLIFIAMAIAGISYYCGMQDVLESTIKQLHKRDSVNTANVTQVDSLKKNYSPIIVKHCIKHCNNK